MRIDDVDGGVVAARATEGNGVRSESAIDGARGRIDGIGSDSGWDGIGGRTGELVLSGPSRRTSTRGFAPGGSAAARIGRDSGPIDSRPPRIANDVVEDAGAGMAISGTEPGASVLSGSVPARGRRIGPAGRKASGWVWGCASAGGGSVLAGGAAGGSVSEAELP